MGTVCYRPLIELADCGYCSAYCMSPKGYSDNKAEILIRQSIETSKLGFCYINVYNIAMFIV